MTHLRYTLLLGILSLALAGCTQFATGTWSSGEAPCGDKPAADKEAKPDKGPKVLMEWALIKKDEKDKDGKDDKEKDKGKDGDEKKNGDAGEKDKENGDNKEPEEEKRLDTDRPHYPEAANTVGVGRAILETGYTYYGSRSTEFQQMQSAPEALLRFGMFYDWLELRIGQNWGDQRVPVTSAPTTPGGPTTTHLETQAGFQDLYLGVKLGLTEQNKWLPETALILSTTVPTGAQPFTNGIMLPGVNYDFGWDVIKDRLAIEGVVEAYGTTDELGHHYTAVGTGLTLVTDLTKKLQNFTEWYGVYAEGAVDPGLAGPQHYLITGFVYFVTNNMEVDVRVGVGLTDHSSDYLTGAGMSIRY